MDDIIRITKSLENSRLLLDGISETIKQEVRLLRMLLGTLGASMLGNNLTGKGILGAAKGFLKAAKDLIIWIKDFSSPFFNQY